MIEFFIAILFNGEIVSVIRRDFRVWIGLRNSLFDLLEDDFRIYVTDDSFSLTNRGDERLDEVVCARLPEFTDHDIIIVGFHVVPD